MYIWDPEISAFIEIPPVFWSLQASSRRYPKAYRITTGIKAIKATTESQNNILRWE